MLRKLVLKIKKLCLMNNAINVAQAQNNWNAAIDTFLWGLKNPCLHDIISENDNKLKIIFLPITTSPSKIEYGNGIQTFDTILVFSSDEFKKIHNSNSILLSEENYLDWVKNKDQVDQIVSKMIFNKVQQDLEEHNYSILKDTDFVELNLEFFTKELPCIKLL